jgi:hypothetical protein
MKALVLCHPKNLEPDLTGHFLGDLFKQVHQKYFPNTPAEYHTVDIQNIRYNTDLKPPHKSHFVADVWSDEFINAHKNEYDIVYMPDCGGRWFKDVLNIEDVSVMNKNLQDILNKTMMLVSKKGILFLSKFWEPQKKYIQSAYPKNATFEMYKSYKFGDYPYVILTKTEEVNIEEKKEEEFNQETIDFINMLKASGATLGEICDMLKPSQIEILFNTLVGGGKRLKAPKKKNVNKKTSKKKNVNKKTSKKKNVNKKTSKKKNVNKKTSKKKNVNKKTSKKK